MNRVLLEVAKAIESGAIGPELALIILSFIVEKKSIIGQDENVALAVAIRRALADVDTDDDLFATLEFIESEQSRTKDPIRRGKNVSAVELAKVLGSIHAAIGTPAGKSSLPILTETSTVLERKPKETLVEAARRAIVERDAANELIVRAREARAKENVDVPARMIVAHGPLWYWNDDVPRTDRWCRTSVGEVVKIALSGSVYANQKPVRVMWVELPGSSLVELSEMPNPPAKVKA